MGGEKKKKGWALISMPTKSKKLKAYIIMPILLIKIVILVAIIILVMIFITYTSIYRIIIDKCNNDINGHSNVITYQ